MGKKFTQSRFLGRNITFYVSNFLLLYNFSTKVLLKFRTTKGQKKAAPKDCAFGYWSLALAVSPSFHKRSLRVVQFAIAEDEELAILNKFTI